MSHANFRKIEYMLVVVDSFNGKHYTPKKTRELAQKGLQDALRDSRISPFYKDGEAWIESREVSGWERIAGIDFRTFDSQMEEN